MTGKSDEIKPGGLVQIIKKTPCCNSDASIGQIFVAGKIVINGIGSCPCGAVYRDNAIEDPIDGDYVSINRLKKIDPPSEGDSLPTRSDKEITA